MDQVPTHRRFGRFSGVHLACLYSRWLDDKNTVELLDLILYEIFDAHLLPGFSSLRHCSTASESMKRETVATSWFLQVEMGISWLISTGNQKKKVLSDPTLPPELRISLAKSLRHDLFFQARCTTEIDQRQLCSWVSICMCQKHILPWLLFIVCPIVPFVVIYAFHQGIPVTLRAWSDLDHWVKVFADCFVNYLCYQLDAIYPLRERCRFHFLSTFRSEYVQPSQLR